MLGVLRALHNGFVPANERLVTYVKPGARDKYISRTGYTCDQESYPVRYVLVAYHTLDKLYCCQRVSIQNQAQKTALLQAASECANVIYEVDFNPAYDEQKNKIQEDYILNLAQLNAILKLK